MKIGCQSPVFPFTFLAFLGIINMIHIHFLWRTRLLAQISFKTGVKRQFSKCGNLPLLRSFVRSLIVGQRSSYTFLCCSEISSSHTSFHSVVFRVRFCSQLCHLHTCRGGMIYISSFSLLPLIIVISKEK